MKMSNEIFKTILKAHITTVPEQGGILGEKDGKIIAYYHDEHSPICEGQAAYEPNAAHLNEIIREWAENGIEFGGMVHSHPKDECTLSEADMLYITNLFGPLEIGSTLYFPIIIPGGIMIPYAVTKKENGLSIVKEEIQLYINRK